jgi:sulfite exporter TauE/SafE
VIGAADLGLVFAAGIAGSLHCAGMCGGFVLALGRGARPQALFHGGKTFTYAFLGAMAGALGASIHELRFAQEALAIFSGAVLVLAGVKLLRASRPSTPRDPSGPAPLRASGGERGLLAESWVGAVRVALSGGPFFAGLLAGFIPCGLVYAAALRAAATSNAAEGALAMAAFGAGTVPSLAAVALGGALVPVRQRARLAALSGALVVAVGALAIARGAFALSAPPASPACPMCSPS